MAPYRGLEELRSLFHYALHFVEEVFEEHHVVFGRRRIAELMHLSTTKNEEHEEKRVKAFVNFVTSSAGA